MSTVPTTITTASTAFPQPLPQPDPFWPAQPVYPALGPNYCTKCASYYAKPGTCNCYATYQWPTITWYPTQPYAQPYTPWYYITTDWNGEPVKTTLTTGTTLTTNAADWGINWLDGGSGQE